MTGRRARRMILAATKRQRREEATGMAALLPGDRTVALTFMCRDEACPWEGRESCGPHLLCFHLHETGVLCDDSQIMQVAPPGVKARCPTLAFLLAREIGNDQAPLWFEHAGDFGDPLPFEGNRQMMHHQG